MLILNFCWVGKQQPKAKSSRGGPNRSCVRRTSSEKAMHGNWHCCECGGGRNHRGESPPFTQVMCSPFRRWCHLTTVFRVPAEKFTNVSILLQQTPTTTKSVKYNFLSNIVLHEGEMFNCIGGQLLPNFLVLKKKERKLAACSIAFIHKPPPWFCSSFKILYLFILFWCLQTRLVKHT